MNDIALIVGPNESGNIRFGEIIHSFRMNSKLSRPKAAERIGVSPEYIRLIERGERTPALGSLFKILDIYEVSYKRKSRSQVVIDENISVKFTSRIKEARQNLPNLTRDELIGQIVIFLVTTDDDTLRKIHSKMT